MKSNVWAVLSVARELPRGRISSLLSFSLAFRALNLLILTPLAAAILRLFLSRWGRASIGNFEIAAFLLSPLGLAAMLVVGTVSLAIFYLEQAGLVRLLAEPRLRWWQAFWGLGSRLTRLVDLGLRQLVALLLLGLPFVAILGAMYVWLWKQEDLYALLVLKPPLFWRGAVPAGLLLALAALLSAWIMARWILALPALLLEPGSTVKAALRRSWTFTKGHFKVIAVVIGGWLLLQALLSAVVLGAIQLGADWVLDRATSSLELAIALTALVLAIDVVVATALSVISSVGLATLVMGLYQSVGGTGVENFQDSDVAEVRSAAGWKPLRWALLGAVAALLVLVSTLEYASYLLITDLDLEDHVEITAHRAGSKLGPENTLAALNRSIEAGADWAEIDVLLTSDGVPAVLHDTDTLRVSGVRHVVDQVTMETISALDVGSLVSPEFAGERIPTLDQMVAASHDRIGLTIELKVKSPREAKALVRTVVAELKPEGSRLCSQSLEAMKLARDLKPGLAVGFIAGAALGDLTRLDVDFLMVNASMASRELVARAAIRKLPVHAWTVNDVDLMTRLIDRGVTNIITSNPVPMIERLEKLRGLGNVERLLVRVRNLISD